MAVSYEDALDTLSTMFSTEGWTKPELDSLLRTQQGDIERTSNVILTNEGVQPSQVLAGLTNTDELVMKKSLQPMKRWFSDQQELHGALSEATKAMAVTKEPINDVESFLVKALVGVGEQHKAKSEKLSGKLKEMEEKKESMKAEIKALEERTAIGDFPRLSQTAM